jgi:hypothetical protein
LAQSEKLSFASRQKLSPLTHPATHRSIEIEQPEGRTDKRGQFVLPVRAPLGLVGQSVRSRCIVVGPWWCRSKENQAKALPGGYVLPPDQSASNRWPCTTDEVRRRAYADYVKRLTSAWRNP